MHKHTPQAGFTLIELSIVLVIIGLIVGGVLIGQDLIKAAKIRSQITQIEQYEAAANTFRGKYAGLPGDLRNAMNTFPPTAVPNSTGICPSVVLGNGTFENCPALPGAIMAEPIAFWHQLYLSNLITDPITNTDLVAGSTPVNDVSVAELPNVFPIAKIGNNNYLMVYTGNTVNMTTTPGMAGVNLYRIAGFAAAGITFAGTPTFSNNLTPLEAFQIDTKKDDGVYNSGVVQATNKTSPVNFNGTGVGAANEDSVNPAANTCVSTVAGRTAYTTDIASGNSRLCQLIIRASF